jgi:tetratricopeptide (TPR) repeat protein
MNNSVFISYRRSVSSFIARAVFQDLRTHGFDVFMDVESIDSGFFDSILTNQIAARPYFVLILSPGTLDRCGELDDWLLQEIQHAVRLNRNIVLVHTVNFNFADCAKFLPAPLNTELPRWNGISLPHDYFDAAMDKLRTRFLKPIALQPELTSPPEADHEIVKRKLNQAIAEPVVTRDQLSAQAYFEQAMSRAARDYEGQITDYTQALRHNPDFAEAYSNRGTAYYCKGDYLNAIVDFTRSIELNNWQLHVPHNNRGLAYLFSDRLKEALDDFNRSIALNDQYADAYNNRGWTRYLMGDYLNALADCERAIQLRPSEEAYHSRGSIYREIGEREKAVNDFRQAIQLGDTEPYAKEMRDFIAAYEHDHKDHTSSQQHPPTGRFTLSG